MYKFFIWLASFFKKKETKTLEESQPVTTEKKHRRYKWYPDHDEKLFKLWEETKDLKYVAEQMNRTESSIRNRLIYYNIPRKDKSNSFKKKETIIEIESKEINETPEPQMVTIQQNNTTRDLNIEFQNLKNFMRREQVIKRAREKHKNSHNPWTEKENERLLQLVENKRSLKDISKELGRSPNAIKIQLDRLIA